MVDYLVRAIGAGGNVRAFAATSTEMIEEARRRHQTWPTATAALGRSLMATALLSATLKEESESITLRIVGDGPLGGIVCDAGMQGRVRGYVRNPHVDLAPRSGKLDVAGAVGQGQIHLTRQLAVEGVYTGTAELISGEIAEDMTYYLTQSEQTPSAVGLGVRVGPEGQVIAAGGYMIQLLPGAIEGVEEQLECNLQAFGSVSSAVGEGASPEEILGRLLAGLDYHILARRDLQFSCRCSRERALGTLALLSPTEIDQMIAEDGGAEMHCHFCAQTYQFSVEDLLAVRNQSEA